MRRYRLISGIAMIALLGGASIAWRADSHGNDTGVPLPGTGALMSVDARTHRAFVLTSAQKGTATRGYLTTVSTNDDSALSTIALGQNPSAMGLDERTGMLFVSDYVDNTVAVIKAGTGVMVRTIGLGPPGQGGRELAIDAHAERVFVAGRPGSSMLDAQRGTLLRRVAGGYAVAISERFDRAFVMDDRRVTVLDARTGAILRAYPLPEGLHDAVVNEHSGRVFVDSNSGGTVLVLNAANGAMVRTLGRSPLASSSIVVDRRAGHILGVGGAPREIAICDGRTGDVLWHLPAGQAPSAPVVDERTGHIFVADAASATLTMIGERDGHVLRRVASQAPTGPLVLDRARGRLFAISHDALAGQGLYLQSGRVSVLDTATGSTLAAFAVGTDPGNVVVDEASGRVVVLSTGGVWARPNRYSWLPDWLRQRLPLLRVGATRTTMPTTSCRALAKIVAANMAR